MLKWIFGGKRNHSGRKAPTYEQARDIAASGNDDERRKLAECDDLQPELLYYFATDKSPSVRSTVAKNNATPLQADLLLARDKDVEVRSTLTKKVGALLPELSPDQNEKVSAMVFEVLDVLARDELPRIRAMVAQEVRSLRNIPKPIIALLARDVEEMVSAPVLEYSPLLEDDDLISMITSGLKSGSLSAVARRRDVSEGVVDAIVETGDEQGVAALLENATSAITDNTFETITRMAQDVTLWHAPIIHRPSLPTATIKRISGFIGSALLKQLSERSDLGDELKTELEEAVEQRVTEEKLEQSDTQADETRQRVKVLFDANALNADAVVDALDKGDLAFVVYALSMLSDLPAETVKKMFTLHSAKTVLAITWKSGFDMDIALLFQRRGANIPANKRLLPTASGGYPLSEKDMEWQLDLL